MTPDLTGHPAHLADLVHPDHHDLVDRLCARVAEIPGDVRRIVEQEVAAVAPLVHGEARRALIAAAVARLVGLGPLEHLLAQPDVTEVLVNGSQVWAERRGCLEDAGTIASGELAAVLERVLAPLGRRLDQTHPMVDARLPDGSRLCAVLQPLSVDGTVLSIRRTTGQHLALDAFADPGQVELLRTLVDRRLNIVISGGTSSGKTSLLAALLTTLQPTERLVVVEDTAELHPAEAHLIRLEARVATPDGPPAISLDQLVRTALRLRPDRLIVGEVRGPEVLALMQALNTGHDGSLTTLHANSAPDALARLETLTLQAAPSWPLAAIRAHLARSVDVIIHMTRSATGARRIDTVVELDETDTETSGHAVTVRTLSGPDRTIAARPHRNRAPGRP